MNKKIIWKTKQIFFRYLVKLSNQLFGKELTNRSRIAKATITAIRNMSAWMSPAHHRQARFERENPDAPWLVPEAIKEIEQSLKSDHVGFEWGCGRSTLWFARRISHITSVEGRRDWFEEVSRLTVNEGLQDKITLVLAEVTTEYDFLPHEIARYAGVITQLKDESLDFILVDGHFRVQCIEKIGKKLRSGGMLIIDNTNVIPESALDELGYLRKTIYNNGISETTLMIRQ